MESLGNDVVSSPNARMESLGNDDVKAEMPEGVLWSGKLQGGARSRGLTSRRWISHSARLSARSANEIIAVCHVERLQAVRSFPVFWLTVSTELVRSSSLRLLCLCLVTFGAVFSNTPRDLERVICCSSIRVFQEMVRALALLYVWYSVIFINTNYLLEQQVWKIFFFSKKSGRWKTKHFIGMTLCEK